MNSQTANASEETAVSGLYHQLLDSWNRRDAAGFAALYDEDGDVIGFDGSQMFGRAEIESTLSQIFADHVTATYVSKLDFCRDIRFDINKKIRDNEAQVIWHSKASVTP